MKGTPWSTAWWRVHFLESQLCKELQSYFVLRDPPPPNPNHPDLILTPLLDPTLTWIWPNFDPKSPPRGQNLSVKVERDTSQCSCSIPWSATGFWRPDSPATPLAGPTQASGMGCDRPFWGGVAATPLLHIGNSRMSRDRGVATPWSATEGGCSVCATWVKIGSNSAQNSV